MNEPGISVVIPVYNRREFLVEAIRSVQRQTRPADEIIVVDDGSTDESHLVAKETGCVVLRTENRGPSAARNTGAGQARYSHVAFLDSDDRFFPEKLERQWEFLCCHPDCVAVHTEEIWIRKGRRVNQRACHEKAGGWIFLRCLPLCAVSPSSVVLNRRIFLEAGGFDESLPACEDYDLWLRLTSLFPFGYLKEPLIEKYGGHDDQLSMQRGLDRFRVAALEKILRAPWLQPLWRKKALEQLLKKLDILEKGYRKHGKPEQAEEFRRKTLFWMNGASLDGWAL